MQPAKAHVIQNVDGDGCPQASGFMITIPFLAAIHNKCVPYTNKVRKLRQQEGGCEQQQGQQRNGAAGLRKVALLGGVAYSKVQNYQLVGPLDKIPFSSDKAPGIDEVLNLRTDKYKHGLTVPKTHRHKP